MSVNSKHKKINFNIKETLKPLLNIRIILSFNKIQLLQKQFAILHEFYFLYFTLFITKFRKYTFLLALWSFKMPMYLGANDKLVIAQRFSDVFRGCRKKRLVKYVAKCEKRVKYLSYCARLLSDN